MEQITSVNSGLPGLREGDCLNVAISVAAIPGLPIEPYIATSVPGGTILAALLAIPSAVSDSLALVTMPSFKSAIDSHGVPSPKYSGILRFGVPPLPH